MIEDLFKFLNELKSDVDKLHQFNENGNSEFEKAIDDIRAKIDEEFHELFSEK